MIKALAYIPYHDWRKILAEGNRTRDAHFIDSFRSNQEIDTLIIINRPITFLELIVKKKKVDFNLFGELIFQKHNGKLYKIDDTTYVLDFKLNQSFQHAIKGRKWFFSAYGNNNFIKFYEECLKFIDCSNIPVISANVFAYQFIESVNGLKLFDAWDNFFLMPGLKSIEKELYNAYSSYGKTTVNWCTNSLENIDFYKKNYNVKNIELVTNGVEMGVFNENNPVPEDLKEIKKNRRPIVGFGGKITHLFDVDIFNFISLNNPDYNFVIIGQILDDNQFKKITKRNNVFYLGDKHYNIYPNYIANLDIGIIPYRIKDQQHGGDSIKAYEYLASGLKVIGTRGNGLQNLEDYIHIADNKEDFNKWLIESSEKSKFPTDNYSWHNKSIKMMEILKGSN